MLEEKFLKSVPNALVPVIYNFSCSIYIAIVQTLMLAEIIYMVTPFQ